MMNQSMIRQNIRQRNIIGVMLFVLMFSLSYIWQGIVPVGSEAPDEAEHIGMINFLTKHHRTPIFEGEEDIFKSILYKKDNLCWVYFPMSYNSPLSYLPFLPLAKEQVNSKDKKGVLPLRFASGLLISFFCLFLFLAMFNLNDGKMFSTLGITLFISLIPQVVFTSSYINIDPIALFLSALGLYLLSIIIKTNQRLYYLFLGIALGLLALCKANYLVVVFYLGLIALWQLLKTSGSTRQKTINFLSISIPFLALNVWWWIRNIELYHDPIIINYISTMIKNIPVDWFLTPKEIGLNYLSIFSFMNFSGTVFYGFYAFLGGVKILLPLIFYYYFYTTLIIFLILGVWQLIKKNHSHLLLFLFSLLIILLDFIIFINKNLTDFSPQGRHLFPLLIPMSVMMIIAIKNWAGRIKRYFLSFIIAISLIANLYATLYIIGGYYINGTAWAVGSAAGKTVPDFSFHNLFYDNYHKLFSVIYADAPAYTGWLSGVAVIFLIFSLGFIIKVLIENLNDTAP